MPVVVLFNTKKDGSGRNLRAVAGPGVRGVLMLDETQRGEFLATIKHNNKPLTKGKGKVPRGVTLTEEDGITAATLEDGDDGPPVCYWVDGEDGDEGEFICWE